MWWSSGAGQAVGKWHSKDRARTSTRKGIPKYHLTQLISKTLKSHQYHSSRKSLIPIPGDSLASLDIPGKTHSLAKNRSLSFRAQSPVFVCLLHSPFVWVSWSYLLPLSRDRNTYWAPTLAAFVLGAGQKPSLPYPLAQGTLSKAMAN